jgi:heavy metal translocating P-type ATPase
MRKLDKYLLAALSVVLALHYAGILAAPLDGGLMSVLSIAATAPVILSALRSLQRRKISVDLLASIALVASLLTRQWASAVFINLMLTSARLFGYYTENKARGAIKSLLKLRPEKARIKRGAEIVQIPINKIAVGDLLVVESGDRIAVDGVIEEGEASIDQSSLTGESVPIPRSRGDEVYSSTLSVAGSIVVKAVRVGKDTTLEKIIGLIESSQNEKAGIRTTADRFASWYIILTLIGAVAVYLVFHDLNLLLSLLLVVCADDIAVAVPMAFLAAIGFAARRGVIIKGGAYLEGLSKAQTFVLDKTGTITSGKLAVVGVTAMPGFTEEKIRMLAGAAESVSEHPVAKAIVRYVKEKGTPFKEPEKFQETPGKGLAAEYGGQELIAGNANYLMEKKIAVPPAAEATIQKAEESGYTVTLIGYGGKLAGFVSTADELRPRARPVVKKLRELGVSKIVMLTGDNERVAKRVADEVGIAEYHAGLLPADKLKYLKRDISSSGKLVMVGDGVNDAAALALADVGIAMGAIGSDAAIEAADIALMRDDLEEIPKTMELGLYTRRVAKQDFWIWGLTNACGILLVAFGVIHPEGAAAFNFITDFFPLMNSLRLFNLHRKLKAKAA